MENQVVLVVAKDGRQLVGVVLGIDVKAVNAAVGSICSRTGLNCQGVRRVLPKHKCLESYAEKSTKRKMFHECERIRYLNAKLAGQQGDLGGMHGKESTSEA